MKQKDQKYLGGHDSSEGDLKAEEDLDKEVSPTNDVNKVGSGLYSRS